MLHYKDYHSGSYMITTYDNDIVQSIIVPTCTKPCTETLIVMHVHVPYTSNNTKHSLTHSLTRTLKALTLVSHD